MDKNTLCLAFDFGASSGRAILGKFDGTKIEIEEIHRFTNDPVRLGNRYVWDFVRLFHDLKQGLKKASNLDGKISSIGVDTWGVDYGFLDKNDNLIGYPMHYRDSRTDNVMEKINKYMPYSDIYKKTGNQFMQLNTLYQLFTDKEIRPLILENADCMLFMPDLFNYFLTGNKFSEYTIASTSQMLNAEKKEWDYELLDQLEIPHNFLQKIIMPGNIYGHLTKEVQEETGLYEIPVVAVGEHDTASAVVGAPLEHKNSAYLSCGTWSLLGIESDEPIINEKSLKYNFTNEGAVGNKIRFLKNINGTYLLQQLRKSWCENVEEVSFPDIIKSAREASNDKFSVNPNHEDFVAPLNMAQAIVEYCKKDGQGEPKTLGEIAMAIYNGLTTEYKNTVLELEDVIGAKIEAIHMVGGGIQDAFLCQYTANKCNKKVVAGPIEASVLGNIVVQLIALGKIKDIEEGRQIIKNSFEQKTYLPS